MTIANKITLLRLFVAVVSFVFMLLGKFEIGFFLIFFAVILDIADGKIARKLGQVSKQGIFLDIMVDKIVIISTFLIIGLKINLIFFYLGILMLLREYSMDTMRSIAASNGKTISADKFSKIKGVLFMVSMLGMIGNHAFLGNDISEKIMILVGSFGMILAYITLARFFILYRKILI